MHSSIRTNSIRQSGAQSLSLALCLSRRWMLRALPSPETTYRLISISILRGGWVLVTPRDVRDRTPFRFFDKIKQCRPVATRYDKLAANYLPFIKLASIRIWLRANESAS